MHCFYSQMLKLSIAWQTEKKHFQDNGEQNKRIPNTPHATTHSTVCTVAYSAFRFSKQPSSLTSFSFRGTYIIRRLVRLIIFRSWKKNVIRVGIFVQRRENEPKNNQNACQVVYIHSLLKSAFSYCTRFEY